MKQQDKRQGALWKSVAGAASGRWRAAGCLFWALALGVIPPLLIFVRAYLIDGALSVRSDAAAFLLALALFCALYLVRAAGQALLEHALFVRSSRRGAALDRARAQKSADVLYAETEKPSFRPLLERAKRAPEADAERFRALCTMVRLAAELVLSAAALAVYDVWAALGIAVLLLFGMALNRALAARTAGFWMRYIERMRRTDYLSSLLLYREYAAERRLFGFEKEIGRRFCAEFSSARRSNARAGRRRLAGEALLQLLFAVYAGAAALLLLRPLLAGAITLGAFTSAFYAAVGLQTACRDASAAVFSASEGRKKLDSFDEFLRLPEEEGTLGEAPSAEICFRGVTFAYPGQPEPVLKGVSFRLEAGRHYALVGENGCGKTTLVKLLLGLYRPQGGEVTVGGVPVEQLSPAGRRRLFSVVFQDLYRYPLTLRENASLSAGHPLSDEEMQAAFARLDLSPSAAEGALGYDVPLLPFKQEGAGLSGGEWQKLAVVRSILSPAPVAVLDEPNASLDPLVERAVNGALRDLLKGRTALFISHRLGTVHTADEILVLRQGKLIGMAPHEALMDSCGYYAELYRTQRGLYEIG